MSLAAIESSYLAQSCDGPRSFDDPDIAPLMVLNEYLVLTHLYFNTQSIISVALVKRDISFENPDNNGGSFLEANQGLRTLLLLRYFS